MVRRARHRALAAASVALLALASGCGEVPVVQGVAEAEANRCLGALERAGVAARKDLDDSAGGGATFRVSVAPDEVARAVDVLGRQALPRREEPGFTEAWGRGSLVQSAAEERARAAQAVAGELARSLETLDGVLDARVHVALPDPAAALDGTTAAPRTRASVLLRCAYPRCPCGDEQVRRLVVGAVGELQPADVQVIALAEATPPPRPPALARVAGIAVARGSAGTLRAALVFLLATNLALGAALIYAILRRR